MALLLLSDGASPVDSMIRLTSAWILVLLAASPVATPFSACDLRMFLAHGPAEQRLPASTTALAEATAARGDGVGISPVMSLGLPTDDSPPKAAVASSRLTTDTAGAHARLGSLARSVRSLRLSATVLRL